MIGAFSLANQDEIGEAHANDFPVPTLTITTDATHSSHLVNTFVTSNASDDFVPHISSALSLLVQ